MKYLLDTNTCIRYINGRAPQIRERMRYIPVQDIGICSIVKAELFYGSAKSSDPIQSRLNQQEFIEQFESLPFDDRAAAIYGPIRAQLQRRGTPIGPLDLLIASIALANDLILVTHNTLEFSRIEGLKLEDWEV